MSAPGYQISRDPTAVVGTRTAAWIVDFLLFFLLALALGPTPLSPLAEYTSTEGLDMTEACDRLRDLDEDVNGCLVIDDNVYFTDTSDGLIQFGVSLALFVLIYVIWQGVAGLTPGKLLVGLRTVGEDGRPPGPLKAFIRSVLWIIDGLPCIPLVGFITALTSTGHRRVGDMAAKTFVVGKADLGRPVVVAGLTSGGYGGPPPYGTQPGYGTPMPGSAPWGTPPSSPGGPAAPGTPGTPSWGTPPSAPPASGSPYPAAPAADARPGPPTSPYGTPAAPGTAGTPSGGYAMPAPAPASDVTGPTAPGQAPAPDAGSFGESGDPADADRPASAATPSAGEAGAAPSTGADQSDQSDKEGEADGARDDASPSGSEAAAEPSEPAEPAAPTESAGEPAAAPTVEASAPSAAGGDATVEQTYSPQWDAARGAYIQWDPNRSRWLQWDDSAKEWKPI